MSGFDFSIQNMIGVIAQLFTGGNVELAGLIVMVAVVFVSLIIMSGLKVPITYSLAPMLLIAVLFTTMGIVNVTLGFVIILITAVLIAREVRSTVLSWRE